MTTTHIDPKHLADKHKGMTISADGVLSRISTQKGSVSRLDKACAEQMLIHLEKMAAAFYAGEISVVDQFLQLYCLDEKRPIQEPSTAPAVAEETAGSR